VIVEKDDKMSVAAVDLHWLSAGTASSRAEWLIVARSGVTG
jgi:hypothetical protein